MAAPTLTKRYVYPPNFTEGSDTMQAGHKRIIVTANLEATAATDVAAETQLIDKSDLVGPVSNGTKTGTEPLTIAIDRLVWTVSAGWNLKLHWDHGTEILIAHLPEGEGDQVYCPPLVDSDQETDAGAGDIVISSDGAADGDFATVTLYGTLKGSRT